MKTIFSILCIFCLSVLCVSAGFTPSDRPTFSVSGNGLSNIGNWTASGTIPLEFIDGYLGARYMHDSIPDDETSRTHLRARVEGGHKWGWFGIRAYGRYGRESVMLQKGLWHGGLNLEAKLFEKDDLTLTAGVGTWAEYYQLLDRYNLEGLETGLESDDQYRDGIYLGPRAHLTLRDKHWLLNTNFLLNHDNTYQIRNYFDFEIPLVKLLFIEQIYLSLNGSVEYYSKPHVVKIDPLQWNWRHELRWKF